MPRSKSNKNKKRGNTSPQEQDEINIGSAPDDNSSHSELLTENDKNSTHSELLIENENLKKTNELHLKELEFLRAENKSLKEELQRKEKSKQSQEVDCRPPKNFTEFKNNAASQEAHYEAPKEVDETPSNWMDGAYGGISESNLEEEDRATQGYNSKNDSRRQEDAKLSLEKQNYTFHERRGSSNSKYSSEPRDSYQRHHSSSKEGWVTFPYKNRDVVNSGRKTSYETNKTSDMNKSSNFEDLHYSQRNKYDKRHYYENDTRKKNYTPIARKSEQLVKVQIEEIDGDLFTAPKSDSLAHCVAQDLRMGSGIAVQFRQNFKKIDELFDQRKKVGEVAILEDNGRFVYYLITKRFSTGKPYIHDLQSSLFEMRDHMEKNAVMSLAIPRLGCGLDRLHWKDVLQLLYDVFADLDVKITVYNFNIDPSTDMSETTRKKSSLYVRDKIMNLADIEKNTLLLLFGSECGYIDSTMKELDEKFNFIYDYKKHSRKVGEVVTLTKRNEMLCILIVKKQERDFILYTDLLKCLSNMRKIFKDQKYYYMGFSAFVDGEDDLTVAKIVTLFKTLFANIPSELWVCWPPELTCVYNKYFPQNI